MLIVTYGIFRLRIVQIRETLIEDCRIADVHEYWFQVRNVKTCALLSSNEIDLLMLRNHVFNKETNRNEPCRHEIF